MKEDAERLLKCPFCGGNVHIVTCDDSGVIHDEEESKEDPRAGLFCGLVHNRSDIPTGIANTTGCPIAEFDVPRKTLGSYLYKNSEEAVTAWSYNFRKMYVSQDLYELAHLFHKEKCAEYDLLLHQYKLLLENKLENR